MPGKPEESLIYQRIVKGQMPPDKLAKELAVELPTASETEKIRAWIAAGAPGASADRPAARRHCEGCRPPVLELPAAQAARRSGGQEPGAGAQPDRRIPAAEAGSQGHDATRARPTASPSCAACIWMSPAVPPTPAEIDAYRKDQSPDAYEKLVDRLLASPRYGERWGQHWLDLAGYSDSEGFGQDDGVRPSAWRYRDYVIRSLNADKPYNAFLTEQIAGDEMSDDWKKCQGRRAAGNDRPPGRHRISCAPCRTPPTPTSAA